MIVAASAAPVPATASGAPKILDQIVATIGKRATTVVTRSDLVNRLVLHVARLGGKPGLANVRTIIRDPLALQRIRELVIAEILLSRDAKKLGLADPRPIDIKARRTLYAAKFADPKAFEVLLRRLELTDDAFDQAIAQELRAERYLDTKLQIVTVFPDEVRAEYARRKASLEGVTFEVARLVLTKELVTKAREARTKKLLHELEMTEGVRRFAFQR